MLQLQIRPALRLSLYAAGLASLVAAQGASGASAGPYAEGLAPEIIVNGQPISQNHVQLMTSGFATDKNGRPLNSADARTAARTELITEEVLAQEARKSGLDKKPAVADQLAFQTREILSRAYLENYFEKNPITDASLKSAYEWNRANGKIVEYKLRQILVPTSSEAREIIGKLNGGSDFAELARVYSQDPGGQNNGGDLGWFRPDIFVDHNFTDALPSLRKGEYSKTPVRSRFGWHVIKVEDGPRPVATPEPYDALSDNVKQALRQKAGQLQIETLTARLTANAKISSGSATGTNGAGQK
ncbi:MAG: peptidylprolyl isomerase [Nevskiaceae bacterium]|nr:MAG: peptidylprolyl isomerase [Nevskiaceae bacterium]